MDYTRVGRRDPRSLSQEFLVLREFDRAALESFMVATTGTMDRKPTELLTVVAPWMSVELTEAAVQARLKKTYEDTMREFQNQIGDGGDA